MFVLVLESIGVMLAYHRTKTARVVMLTFTKVNETVLFGSRLCENNFNWQYISLMIVNPANSQRLCPRLASRTDPGMQPRRRILRQTLSSLLLFLLLFIKAN